MRDYTIYDLGLNVDGEKFIMPIEIDNEKFDEDILKKTLDLFRPYLIIDKKKNIEIDEKYNDIQIPCLYEGYDGYYPYEIYLEVFRLKYDDQKRLYKKDKTEVKNDQLMVALYVQAEELLNELIDIKVLPNLIEKTRLERYIYCKRTQVHKSIND